MLKHKKVLVLAGIFCVCLLSGVIFWLNIQRKSQTTASTSDLSDRAISFIADDRADGTGLWNEVQVLADDEQTALTPSGATQNECFSASLPWESYNHQLEQSEDRCAWRFKVFKPTALVTISMYPQANPTEDASITLRERQPDLYQLREQEFSSFPEAKWYHDAESETIFLPQDGYTIVLSYTPAVPSQEPPIAPIQALVATLKPILSAGDGDTINE